MTFDHKTEELIVWRKKMGIYEELVARGLIA